MMLRMNMLTTNQDIEEFKQSLQLNTLRMLKDKKYMKVIKRIFAQEKSFFKNNYMIETIYYFLISDAGRLNKINNDLKALLEIIESKTGPIPMKQTIKTELDSLIDNLASVNLIDYDLEKLDILINEAINTLNKKKFVTILETLIKDIDTITKKEAYAFLNENGLLPLPEQYLPKSTKKIMASNILKK